MGKGEAFYNPRSRSQALVDLCLWSVKFTSMSQLPLNLLLRKGTKVDYFPTSSVKLWQISLLWRQAENKKFWTYSKTSIFPWAYSPWLNFPLLLLEHEGSFLGLYPGKLEELYRQISLQWHPWLCPLEFLTHTQSSQQFINYHHLNIFPFLFPHLLLLVSCDSLYLPVPLVVGKVWFCHVTSILWHI